MGKKGTIWGLNVADGTASALIIGTNAVPCRVGLINILGTGDTVLYDGTGTTGAVVLRTNGAKTISCNPPITISTGLYIDISGGQTYEIGWV